MRVIFTLIATTRISLEVPDGTDLDTLPDEIFDKATDQTQKESPDWEIESRSEL